MSQGGVAWVAWAGSFLVILGRFLLANGFYAMGFLVAALGDCLFIIWGSVNRVWSIVILDILLLVADIFGLASETYSGRLLTLP